MPGSCGGVSELSRRYRCDRDGGEECGEDEQPSAESGHLSPPVNVSHARAVKNSTQKIVQAIVIWSPVSDVQVVGVSRNLEHAA